MRADILVSSKKLIILLLSVIALLSLALLTHVTLAAPSATTWYVDTATGSDADDCLTPATACLTVAQAVSRAANGDTIQIAPGVYIESLDISLELTLQGAGAGITFLDGGHSLPVLKTAGIAQITLANLTIRNGVASGLGGGGIYNLGNLSLQSVIVSGNTSSQYGGGIFNGGTLLLQNSQVISNTAAFTGGGVMSWTQGVITATNTLFAGNTAAQGGGIFSQNSLDIQDSTLSGDSASQFGGGLAVGGGVASLRSVTVSGNTADSYAAGVLNSLATLFLTNVTISGNSAPNYVGLASLDANTQTTVLNSTIANNQVIGGGTRYGGIANSSAAMILQNTIVANNGGRNCLASGVWTSLGNNLSSDNFCAFTQTGDVMNLDPLLSVLGAYGGNTLTHALLPGSPAIDHGNNGACPTTDQRGVARPVDGENDGTATCDMGAFEARNQLAINNVSVTEGNSGTTSAIFTVTLAPTSTQAVSVDYATANGAAISGSDYTAASGTLNFAPGQPTRTITVHVIGDANDEPDEDFLVNLANAANADIIFAQGIGDIIDDDGLSSLSVNDVNVNEGDSGVTPATFTVSLSPAASQPVTVNFTTSNGSAQAGSDYTAASGSLTFNPGQTTRTIDVSILGDQVDEGAQEDFSVTLSSPSNAILADSAGSGTIVDDDIAQVSVNSSLPVQEGDSGTAQIIFTITLTRPAAFSVTVDYTTSSGNGGTFATPTVDYTDVSGSLNFTPGVTSLDVPVQVNGDVLYEADEVFSFTLSNASPVSIYGASALGTILNDDAARIYLPMIRR